MFIPNQEVTDEFENAVESGGWDEIAYALRTHRCIIEKIEK